MLGQRQLHYVCPCGFVETQMIDRPKARIPVPEEERIACTCQRCFSGMLDKVYPGARERMEKRLAREEKRKLRDK